MNQIQEIIEQNNYQMNLKLTLKLLMFFNQLIIYLMIIFIKIIKFIEKIDGKTIYFIGGVGQLLFEIELEGKEDCFMVTEKNIINQNKNKCTK